MKLLNFISAYLSKRKQKTKVDSTFGEFLNILLGVPQGSITCPLLFNIDICDMFFEHISTEFSSYADNNTPYLYGSDYDTVLKELENTICSIFSRYRKNQFKTNAGRYQIL